MARDQGWSLSEKGFLRIGEDGEPLTGDAAELRTFATEAEAYAFLGLPFIEPELREDAGEIEAALAGPAARRSSPRPTCAATCTRHSDWSDGTHPIEVMAEAARRRGYAYQVLTDHTQSLAIARGLDARAGRAAARDHRRAQRPVRRRGGGRHGARRRRRPRASGCSTAASSRSAPTARSTTRTTCWRRFDLVVASVHVSRRQPRAELTRRTLNAIRSPHVDVIAHPSGPDDRHARRPRPRLGRGLRRGRADRDRARDERLAAAARPRRRARPPRGRGRLPARRSIRTPTTPASSTTCAGASARRVGRGSTPADVAQHARRARTLLAWVAGKPERDVNAARVPSPAMDDRIGPARPRARRRDHRRAVAPARAARHLARRRRCCSARCCSARSRSSPTRLRRPRRLAGVPIESLILPSVAAVACLGAIRLVPFGLWLVPALAADRVPRRRGRSRSRRGSTPRPERPDAPTTGRRCSSRSCSWRSSAFTGVAAMVPGGLAQPAGRGAARADPGAACSSLAAGDAAHRRSCSGTGRRRSG